ncbi:MAG TPA: tetratricopeptide repeat protein [Blastocatellia bacterium]|nr:tetratricopeptide repeat protein [Blastocatellia bacterium]
MNDNPSSENGVKERARSERGNKPRHQETGHRALHGARVRWAQLAIVITAALVYANSFEGKLVFDDRPLIEDNSYIRHLWPPWSSMLGPTQIDRPLNGLSLAINYAISGLHLWSYHALNLMIHSLAALALFGVVRRTLLRQRPQHLVTNSTALAFVVALIWMVHPLQTASVTYVIQRCESMMGLFYLATLYFAIRGFDSEPRSRTWNILAVVTCTAGMLSKQVMVTAPVMILLYDWLFVAKSFAEIKARRKWLYAGLAATWLPLAVTVAASPANTTAGFAVREITPLRYFVSEFRVIVHYIRLSLWPDALCLDYKWPEARRFLEIVPYGVLLAALAGAALFFYLRRNPLSFTGIWFFLILSVTSSFMPFSDLAFEHRMYLPLAGIVTLLVVGSYMCAVKVRERFGQPSGKLGRDLALALATVIIGSLAAATVARNVLYKSGIVMWTDVATKRPGSDRAQNNLGLFLDDAHRTSEAKEHFLKAAELAPGSSESQDNLGRALSEEGDVDGAMSHFLRALDLNPSSIKSHCNLGAMLDHQGKITEAEAQFRRALEIDPSFAPAHFRLGLVLEKEGNHQAATREFDTALQLNPDLPELLDYLKDRSSSPPS